MDELLKSAAGDIQIDFPAAPDASPSVIVKDSAGTTLTSGTSTVTSDATIFKFSLTPAQLAQVDVYTATWTATIGGQVDTYETQFEVVGGFLFTIEELRAFDTNLPSATYPDAKVRDAREAAQNRLETLLGVAMRRRGSREELDGTGTRDIQVLNREPRRVVSGSIDSTALTAGDITDLKYYPSGRIRRKTGSWGWGDLNVTLFYEHGFTQAPEPVRRACMALARANLVGNEMWSRRTGEQTDIGFFRLTLAGRAGSPTGLPEVDAVIQQYGRTIPGIA